MGPTTDQSERKLFDLDGLSSYLAVPKATIYGWTHQKKLPHFKLGKALRFDLAEINAWLDARRVTALQLAQ